MREERQALAGLSASASPASRARVRISALVSWAVTRGARAPCCDGGLLAGAEVATVVEVHAIGDVRRSCECHGIVSMWVKSSSLQWKQRLASLRW